MLKYTIDKRHGGLSFGHKTVLEEEVVFETIFKINVNVTGPISIIKRTSNKGEAGPCSFRPQIGLKRNFSFSHFAKLSL